MTRSRVFSALPFATIILAAVSAYAGPPLETETARLPARGEFSTDFAFEFQTSSEGTERAVPVALEYGLSDRIELLAEPVLYTALRPNGASGATGIGDLELTVTGLVSPERGNRPALALAGEVKVPTSEDLLIGSDAADYTFYVIASSRRGRFDTHANVGYALIGSPPGVDVNNVASFAVGEEFRFSPRVDFVGEVFANTSALPEAPSGPGGESAVTPEIGGSEVFGMLGVRYRPRGDVALNLSLSVDNNGAVLVRPGVTLGLR